MQVMPQYALQTGILMNYRTTILLRNVLIGRGQSDNRRQDRLTQREILSDGSSDKMLTNQPRSPSKHRLARKKQKGP